MVLAEGYKHTSMERKRKSTYKSHTTNLFFTKVQNQFSGEKIEFSTKDVGTMGSRKINVNLNFMPYTNINSK